MMPKWCSCSHSDVVLCCSLLIPPGRCPCACHKVERRSVADVEADLRSQLAARGTLRSDRAEVPQGPSFFSLSDGRQEVVIEYEPAEGFGLTLTGWCEDEDRTYTIESVVKKVGYWFDGNI